MSTSAILLQECTLDLLPKPEIVKKKTREVVANSKVSTNGKCTSNGTAIQWIVHVIQSFSLTPNSAKLFRPKEYVLMTRVCEVIRYFHVNS